MAATGPAATTVHLELAHNACVRRDGSATPLAPRDAALLAWLALEGPTPRQRLASLLWPESAPEAARNALRQRLFQLNRQFGAVLVEGSPLALAGGVGHDLLDSDGVLEAVTPDIGGEFGAWLQQQRWRRRQRNRQELVELAEMAERARDWNDALSHAGELLILEPLSEDAHRRVMRLHYLAGDRAAALLAFDHCERVLKDEVGAAPSAETLALLRTIEASGRGVGAVPPPAAVPASVLRPPRLIGREAELTALAEGWAAAQVVAVVGEAGMGKSRLLQEVAASDPGIVHVAARPGDAGVPLALLARLLRAVRAMGERRGAIAPLAIAQRAELARVLPEFDVGLPRAAGEGQRLVLQRAVQSLLTTETGLAGLLVDDLHFADEASLDMLRALIDETALAGVEAVPALRWALAYRPAEAASPLHALQDALTEHARLQPLRLEPLDEAQLAELVDSLGLPGVPGRALAPALLRRTGGNPLFVLETLKQAWVERSLDKLADDRRLPRPLSVGRLMERRITQLSPAALTLARVASIAGVDFDIALAEHVLGVSAMQLADALNELEAAQVMRGNAFAHDLVFEAVRASVPATIAAHTHAQVASWLEQRGGEPARIAGHWLDAHRDALALPWLQRAADAARLALRSKECIAFLERKSAIEEAAGDRPAAFASLLAAAEEFVNVDLDGATTADHCERLDRLASTPADRVEALLHRAYLNQQQGQYGAAMELARAALDGSEALDDIGLTMRCRRMLSSTCVMNHRFDEGSRQLESCITWFDEHGSVAERSECHGDLAVMYDNLGRLDDALPHHTQSYELSRRSGNLSNASMACNNFACNRIDAGDLPAAEASLARSRQLLAAYDGFHAHNGILQTLQALCLCQLGRYTEALDRAQAAVQSMRDYQPGHVDHAALRLAWCWWHLGQWSRLAQALAAVQVGPASSVPVRVLHARLRWRLARGGEDGGGPAMTATTTAAAAGAARDAMLAELAALGAHERPDLRLPLQMELASCAPPQAALRQLDLVRDEAERIGHQGTVLAARVRAAALAAPVDAPRARREALAALALSGTRQSTTLLPAELWLHCARALAAAGDAAHAAEVLAQGHDWLRTTAARHVPDEFRDGFLHRNPVNRELLALHAQWHR